jgi:hypothetical protein
LTLIALLDYFNSPIRGDAMLAALSLYRPQAREAAATGDTFQMHVQGAPSPSSAAQMIQEWSAAFRCVTSGAPVDVGVHFGHGTVCPVPLIRPGQPMYQSRVGDRLPDLMGSAEGRWDWLPAPGQLKRLRSTIQLKRYDLSVARDEEARVDDWVITNRELVPAVPSLLMVISACRGMAEPSLANAFHQRGTRFVLGVRLAPRPKQMLDHVNAFLAACHTADGFSEAGIINAFTKLMNRRPGAENWPEPCLSVHPVVGLGAHEYTPGMIRGAQNLPWVS